MIERRPSGYSLVEALVALLLGCLLILAAVSVFLSSRRVMEASSALTVAQESTRAAFEILGRDLREAGGNPCASTLVYGNLLNTSATPWWIQAGQGLRGYAGDDDTPGTGVGTSPAQRLAGTQALDIHSALAGPQTQVVAKMPTESANLEVVSSAGFAPGDIALVCDPVAGYIFQVTQIRGSGTQIQHNSGAGTPGNCASEFPPASAPCSNAATGYLFGPNAQVARLSHVRWYVGNNARGGTSLFRATLSNPTGADTPASVVPVEIAPGVTGMDLEYQVVGVPGFVGPDAVGDWRQVSAVRIRFDLQVPMEGRAQRLDRAPTQVVSLRNRFP